MQYSPTKMKELLEQYGFNFKKMFGQNFIIDENIIKNIIDKAEIDCNTLVLEIGPGAGSLTYYLSDTAKEVVSYEIDTKLEPILAETLENKKNVTIIFEDFLKANVKEELKKHNYSKLYVVANLPYYITTPIIMKLIEDNIDVDKIVIMVQKEVGDRFKATPNSKDYSSLSIFLDYYFEIKKLMDVSRNVFIPKPNIDSIIIQMKKRHQLIDVGNKEFFFKLIKDSFKQKRKNLRNNLKNYDLEQISSILKTKGYDLTIRAEQLSIEDFSQISKNYKN